MQVLKHAVKAVVHNCIPVCKTVILIHLVPEAAVFGAKSHVIYNSRSTTASRSNRSIIEIVDRPGKAHIEIHVSVYINSSRHYVHSRSINDICAFTAYILTDLGDLPTVNQDICFKDVRIRCNFSVSYYLLHGLLLFLFAVVSILERELCTQNPVSRVVRSCYRRCRRYGGDLAYALSTV